MTAVSNSSPLIGLSAIGLLDLLPALYGTINIPEAVYEEVVVKGKGRAGARRIAKAPWITRHTLTDQHAVAQFLKQTNLQQGESEAILLAVHLSATTIILDDAEARVVATAQGLSVIGTVGILLLAKQNKLIPAVKKPLDALIAYSIRISPAVYKAALIKAGE